MNRWHFLTPQNVLLFGNNNLIEGYIDDPAIAQNLMASARKIYVADSGIQFLDFTYPFISAAAVHNIQNENAKQISSLDQAISFLSSVEGQNVPAEENATRFYNSIVAARFADYGHDKTLAEKITGAFLSSELLQYPKDKAALNNAQFTNKLPGVMNFLLDREQINQKSFCQYLRRGTPPEISYKIFWTEVNHKKSISTCSLEFSFEEEFLSKSYDFNEYDYEVKKSSQDDLLEVLETIYGAMRRSEQAARSAAAEHRLSFDKQIQEKFGIIPQINEEPYLEAEIKRFELQLLQTLERLANRMEKLLKGKKYSLLYLEEKKIDPRQDIPPQVEEQVIFETNHMKGRIKQALDRYRQQQLGITHYIWRSQDDSKVRPEHAANDDKLFAWAKPPKGGHPGEAFNCRCYAEPAGDNAGAPTLDIENQFDVAAFGPAIRLILSQMAKRVAKAPKPKLPKKIPKLNDTKTWPKPPAKGKLKEGKPSRAKPRNRGEKSLYDEKGGE